MDDWKALLPEWLRFLKGVIDCEDLTLNVSREMLQHDRQVKAIRTFATKKTLDAIERLQKDTPDAMRTLWAEFGAVLKEGLAGDSEFRDRLLDLVLCGDDARRGDQPRWATTWNGWVTTRNPSTIWAARRSTGSGTRPTSSSFISRGIEVLFFADPVDEFWLQHDLSYKDTEVRLDQAGRDQPREEKAKEAKTPRPTKVTTPDSTDCSRRCGRTYRTTSRMCDCPAASQTAPSVWSATHDDLSPRLEQMMRQMGQEPPKTKRILEVNPDHAFIERLRAIHSANNKAPELDTYAHLLHGQAILAEGGTLPDPSAYSRIVMEVANQAVSAGAASGE